MWVTRFRRKILVRGVREYLKVKLLEVRAHYPDWEFIEMGIAPDHVHLYMVIPPRYAVSRVVETIKKKTSRHLSKKFAFLKKVYWDEQGIWGTGFFASTVGINERVIRHYVSMQGKEEAGQAELEL